MWRRKESARLLAGIAGAALVLAGCGGGGGDRGEGGGRGQPLVIGTTDTVSALDPAGAYDLGSSTLQYNLYQQLVTIPPGGNKPAGQAAQACDFTDPKTYRCTLRGGLKFSNGDPLTSADVKHSFGRLWRIDDPNSAAVLYQIPDPADAKKRVPAATIETPDAGTVVFKLKEADATWPAKLTYAAASIVPSKVFPADKLLDDSRVVGSGPYRLTRFQKGQQAVFAENREFTGEDKPRTPNVIVRYFQQSSALKLGIERGEVDVAYRSLAPTEIRDLKGASSRGVKVVTGKGTEIRYLVFNVKKAPFDKKEMRQAMALTVNRDPIVQRVYNGDAEPLFSMVAIGLDGYVPAFQEKYGAQPDLQRAKQLIRQAGLTAPVPITLWYSPSHYGPATADELNELKRGLESSGAFKVTLRNAEWEQYQDSYQDEVYAVFHLGWFPDYPDPDDYLSPFLVNGGFFNQNYNNPQINSLIGREQALTETAHRTPILQQIQRMAAEDVPTLPLWQAKQVAAVRTGVTGVENTFDPSFKFRFRLIAKK